MKTPQPTTTFCGEELKVFSLRSRSKAKMSLSQLIFSVVVEVYLASAIGQEKEIKEHSN